MAKKPSTRKKSSTPKKTALKTTKAELLGYYREMLLIRRFEEKAGQLYGMGQIAGFCHLYICLLYTSPSPRDQRGSRMPSSA